MIGSVSDEPNRSQQQDNELRHAVNLTRPFAILDREVTFEEFIAFSPADTGIMQQFKCFRTRTERFPIQPQNLDDRLSFRRPGEQFTLGPSHRLFDDRAYIFRRSRHPILYRPGNASRSGVSNRSELAALGFGGHKDWFGLIYVGHASEF